MSSLNVNLMRPDGGSSPKVEPIEGLELDTPIHLNNLLYDISSHYSAGVQDLIDSVIQIKSVNSSIETNSIWDSEYVKEAVTASGLNSIEDITDISDFDVGESDFYKYAEDVSTELYNSFEEFSTYAIGIEYVIALIEKELKDSLKPEEYEAFINDVKDNKNINSLRALEEDSRVSEYIEIALKEIGGTAGSSTWGAVAPQGVIPLIAIIKNEGIESFLDRLNTKALFKGAFDNFLSGTTGGKVPEVGSTLVSSTAVAAAFFVLGLAMDAMDGNINKEDVAIRAAQGVVSVGASMAGTAVISALEGSAFAGPLGMVVAAGVSILGNLIINGIVHDIHYASNDLPREYKAIELENIKSQMLDAGYLVASPKAGTFETESVYDVCALLIQEGADPKFIEFLQQKVYGENIEVMPDIEFEHYLTIFNRFRNTINSSPYGYDISDPEKACRDFITDYHRLVNSVWEGDDEYIESLFNLYCSGNEDVERIFEGIINRQLFTNYDNYHTVYNPDYN